MRTTVILLGVFLFSATHAQSEGRFVISEHFTDVETAVAYANSFPITRRFSAQFVPVFHNDGPISVTYQVVIDQNWWLNNEFAPVFEEWYYGGRFKSIVKAVESIERFNKRPGYEVRGQFAGYWNRILDPTSTYIDVFLLSYSSDAIFGFKWDCHYTVVEEDFGPAENALEYANKHFGKSDVQFVSRFTLMSSMYGSIWLIEGGCYKRERYYGRWQVLEYDDEGHMFSLESAAEYAEKKRIKNPQFVSFTHPGDRNPKGRIMIFCLR